MEVKHLGSKIVMRLDKGEEIIESLKNFCQSHNVKLAAVTGIGAVNKVSVGIFMQNTKEYHSTELQGNMEITSLMGNVTQKNGEVYVHLHVNLADENYQVHGGHLNSAWIGATGEFIIDITDGKVEREYSEEIGLNLMKFSI
jgi:predicted DNA-binding protein with PD1-like motif